MTLFYVLAGIIVILALLNLLASTATRRRRRKRRNNGGDRWSLTDIPVDVIADQGAGDAGSFFDGGLGDWS